MVARQFGCLPWELLEAPADRYLEMMQWLELEATLEKQYPAKG